MVTPTIAMIPSGYKNSKVYSQLPINGDGDLTFTRASSATRVNENGLIEEVASNIPRLDYSDGGCPSLLLEPQSTNLITYSEDFSNPYWIKSNTTVSADATLAPDGNLTSDKIVESATTSTHRILNGTIAVTPTTPVTYSIFVKTAEVTKIGFVEGFTGQQIAFDLTDNSTIFTTGVTTTALLVDYANGFTRISLSYTSSGSGNSAWNVYLLNDAYTSGSLTTYTYLGNVSNGLCIWGAQLEQQSYATSYIPTTGATATRIADVASLTTTGFGLTSITETFKDGSTNVITTIPTTYNVSEGKIAKIIGE